MRCLRSLTDPIARVHLHPSPALLPALGRMLLPIAVTPAVRIDLARIVTSAVMSAAGRRGKGGKK